MKKAKKRAEKRGLKVTFYAGGNLDIEIDGKVASVRGYIKGDQVYVRVDHPYYTADQLMRHEIGHDMIARGEVDVDEVRERINDRFEDVDFIVERYTEAYEGSGLDADEIWEEIICDSLGDMNIFASVEVLGEINDVFLEELKEEIYKSRKDARGPPKSAEGRASRVVKYISYSKVSIQDRSEFSKQLKDLYGDVENGIADEIAVAVGKTVYIVDSERENGGKINYGIRERKTISDPGYREKFIRRQNSEGVPRGRVSDELSLRFRDKWGSNFESNLRRESGAKLSTDKRESQDNQSGVSGKNANNRGLKGKASQDLDFIDFLNENAEEQELSSREILANMLDSVAESDTAKRMLSRYKESIARVQENEAKIASLKEEKKGASNTQNYAA